MIIMLMMMMIKIMKNMISCKYFQEQANSPSGLSPDLKQEKMKLFTKTFNIITALILIFIIIIMIMIITKIGISSDQKKGKVKILYETLIPPPQQCVCSPHKV